MDKIEELEGIITRLRSDMEALKVSEKEANKKFIEVNATLQQVRHQAEHYLKKADETMAAFDRRTKKLQLLIHQLVSNYDEDARKQFLLTHNDVLGGNVIL